MPILFFVYHFLYVYVIICSERDDFMFYLQYGRFVVLAIFVAVSCLHLFLNKKKNLTKAFLLPLILLYYLTSVHEISLFLVSAIAFSWLGDVLLIKSGMKWFVAGGISFLVSHIFYIIVYVLNSNMSSVRWYMVIASALLFTAASGIIIYKIKPWTPEKMPIPLFLYLFFNGCMNVFAMVRFSSTLSPGAVVTVIGALLFFISDCCLFIGRFYKKKKYKTFLPVMATYIVGEFLITQGLIMS